MPWVWLPTRFYHQSSTLLFLVICLWPWMTAPGSAQRYGLHGHYSTTNQRWIAGTKCYHSHQDDRLTCPCANNRNVTNVRFGPAGNDALDVCFETWKPSNSAASLWRPATLMVIVRKMRVTCIFHCWKGACVLWKTRWSATRTTTIIVPIG